SERGYSAAEWSFRWLWNQPGIMCVLSGMNDIAQVEENLKIADSAKINDFSEEDFKTIESIKNAIKLHEKVGCTGCRYCMPCPKGVDIPGNFYYYNLMGIQSKFTARLNFAMAMGVRVNPGFADQCVNCGKCESHCPQHLPIRNLLKEADKNLRPFPYKVGIAVARKVKLK
ncbi:MAG: 4Fe-4S dicluster domain-containing protein, partial [Erysipelotrichaceae bacterium]|nr:4Fe-4S dicluster domain-containing protein [Erysipelotrichaceae bacterium]